LFSGLIAQDIFINNNFGNEKIFIEEDAFFRLKAEEFDIIINLDTSKIDSAIADGASAKEEIGFDLNNK
jgi:hypothetical protein